MTKMLEQAFATASELPDADQDDIAAIVLSIAKAAAALPPLDDESRAAIAEGRAQARRGEFMSDEQIADIWKRFGA
jgi:hypothetical protein